MSTNEWYTPTKYLEAVRAVLGEIDLDPASCVFANRVVQAHRYYTLEDNGLMHLWYGRVFLNPPYGKTAMGQASNLAAFTNHLLNQYDCGNVTEAIVPVPVNTATRWFERLWQYPIYFPHARIHFYNERDRVLVPRWGPTLSTLGTHEERFIEVFQRFGRIAKAIHTIPSTPAAHEIWGESEQFA